MTYIEYINFRLPLQEIRKTDKETFYHNHHIKPVFMGGTKKDGLIKLTLLEHITAHYLLALEHEKTNLYIYSGNISAAHMIFSHEKRLCMEKKQKAVEKFLSNPNNQDLINDIIRRLKGRVRTQPKCNFQWSWYQYKLQKPSAKTTRHKLKKDEIQITNCPICHQPNSRESFACCYEHKQEYFAILKQQFKKYMIKINFEIGSRPEVREKRVELRLGKKWSTEIKQKISQSHLGKTIENTKNYKGGFTKENQENRKKQIAENRKNTIFIFKDNQEKFIKKELFSLYEENGWQKGRLPFSDKTKIKQSNSAKIRVATSQRNKKGKFSAQAT